MITATVYKVVYPTTGRLVGFVRASSEKDAQRKATKKYGHCQFGYIVVED